jgi:hypothetical protein
VENDVGVYDEIAGGCWGEFVVFLRAGWVEGGATVDVVAEVVFPDNLERRRAFGIGE